MSRLSVTLIDGVSKGPRDGAVFESRGPGAENLAPTYPYKVPFYIVLLSNIRVSIRMKYYHLTKESKKKLLDKYIHCYFRETIIYL